MEENGSKSRGSTPYDRMKDLLEELNAGAPRREQWTVRGERTILAMAGNNDPFYAGQPAQAEKAQWLAELYHRLGFGQRRTHLRFIHYTFAGEEPNPITGEKMQERLPDGTPYKNTDENWAFLGEASKFARNMGLIDPRQIIDRRTPRPYLFGPQSPPEPPSVHVSEPSVSLPEIEVDALEPSLSKGDAFATGYQHTHAHEPSLIELWAEKNLDDADAPLIEDLCRELGVSLVTGIGFMTISSVYALLERRAAFGKPLRILYLSDFDPAGDSMPVSPARHIEFAISQMEEEPDIRLHHLALTHQQVSGEDFGPLPRIPIKDSDMRKSSFEERRGKGAIELNALVSEVRVERFEQALRLAVTELRDPELPRKLRAARREADELLEEEMRRRLRWPHRALELLEEQAREIGEKYTEELQDIADRLAGEMAPLEERRDRVRQAVTRKLADLDELKLPTAEGEEDADAAEGWLFDSRRDYFDQLDAYKTR